jgi:type IV pilus assembly protein PilA
MLRFFAKRLKELQEVQRDERGFTLIELLIVCIIIGVLAAIAIPAFLAQRERAWEAAAQSDLRNAAAAAVSCATSNGGPFNGAAPLEDCYDITILDAYGYNVSPQVTVTPDDTGAPDVWAATSVNTNGGDTFTFNSDDGVVTRVP